MERRTIRLESGDGRWLEMTVEDDRALARIGDPRGLAEPFPFSFENLGFVARGIGYQAWGSGSHFAFRNETGGVALEFQRLGDRSPAVLHLSQDSLRAAIDQLNALAPTASGANML